MSSGGTLRPETTYQAVIGRVVVKFRKKMLVEQASLAKNVGVTQSTWSRIERGESSLTVEQLARAADYLRVKPSTILYDTEEAVKSLEKQGVFVNKNKKTENKEVGKTKTNQGVAMIGAAALGALVATAIRNSRNSDNK